MKVPYIMGKGHIEEKIKKAVEEIKKWKQEISLRLVGQNQLLEGILMGLIADGHVLLEGVPGLAKTLAVKTLAEVMDVDFKRIQFTPDLLPADLIGTMVYSQETGKFYARKGPIFANIILADEINRAPAKVQSALLEAMEERQVTIGDTTYPLPSPFFVLATQNPIEHEGTYPLPEAQIDRFLLKLKVDYPSFHEEIEIIDRMGENPTIKVGKVISSNAISNIREALSSINVDNRIVEYIVSLVTASRGNSKSDYPFSRYIEYGASPRASLYLFRCARVRALLEGRSFVIPDDVKKEAINVMRHRIILTYEAEAEELTTDDIIKQILSVVPVP